MFKIIMHKRIVNAYNDSLHKFFICIYQLSIFLFIDTNTKSLSKSLQISQFKTFNLFLITKNILVIEL